MNEDRYASLAAMSGGLATILIVGAFGALVLPNAPDTDASATAWANYYIDHGSRIQVGLVIAGVGLFFFAWFLGSVRSALARAEGGYSRLTAVAFAGGIISIVTLLIPAWVAGFSALAAITQPLAYGVAVTDSGVFAADGILGAFIPIISFVLAMMSLSAALTRKPAGDPGATRTQ